MENRDRGMGSPPGSGGRGAATVDRIGREHLIMKYIQSVIIPLLVAILVGIGSSAVTSAIYIGRMDERLSSLENTQARHEGMFTTLRDRTDDHERRLAKTEATMDAVSLDLREIKADVKSLVRGTP